MTEALYEQYQKLRAEAQIHRFAIDRMDKILSMEDPMINLKFYPRERDMVEDMYGPYYDSSEAVEVHAGFGRLYPSEPFVEVIKYLREIEYEKLRDVERKMGEL